MPVELGPPTEELLADGLTTIDAYMAACLAVIAQSSPRELQKRTQAIQAEYSVADRAVRPDTERVQWGVFSQVARSTLRDTISIGPNAIEVVSPATERTEADDSELDEGESAADAASSRLAAVHVLGSNAVGTELAQFILFRQDQERTRQALPYLQERLLAAQRLLATNEERETQIQTARDERASAKASLRAKNTNQGWDNFTDVMRQTTQTLEIGPSGIVIPSPPATATASIRIKAGSHDITLTAAQVTVHNSSELAAQRILDDRTVRAALGTYLQLLQSREAARPQLPSLERQNAHAWNLNKLLGKLATRRQLRWLAVGVVAGAALGFLPGRWVYEQTSHRLSTQQKENLMYKSDEQYMGSEFGIITIGGCAYFWRLALFREDGQRRANKLLRTGRPLPARYQKGLSTQPILPAPEVTFEAASEESGESEVSNAT